MMTGRPLGMPLSLFVTLCLAASAGAGVAAPAAPAHHSAPAAGDPAAAAEVAAARALFEANLQAIRDRNTAAYLACYLDSPRMATAGPEGFTAGFDHLKESAGKGWPDHIDASAIHLLWLRPGLVYGTYRYRVRYGADEQSGISERYFVKTPAGWRIAVTTAFGEPPGTPPPPRALVGATLLDGTGGPAVAGAVVLLREGKIECAGTRAACPLPADAEVLDVSGMWITPGVVDSHVHFSQTGWADGRPDGLDLRAKYPYDQVEAGLRQHPERFGHTYLCSGVTAVFDVGGYPWTLALPAWAEPRAELPRIVAVGPLVSTLDFWLNLPGERQFIFVHDEATSREAVRYLAAEGAAAVKIWFIRAKPVPELEPIVAAAGDEARRHKLPLIVHATGLATAKAALRSGANLLVHSVWDQPVDDEFLDLAKSHGTIYCPTLTVGRGNLRLYESAARHEPPQVDDPNGCVDPETLAHVAATATTADLQKPHSADERANDETIGAKAESIGAANLLRVARAGIPIAMGTDAGNPLTLHGVSVYAEMEAMQRAGLSPSEVLVAATRGSATAMGRAADLGTIEKGKLADLLILAADPAADIANLRRLRYVVRGGVIRTIAELHALAAGTPHPQ
jgi:imidazolonepropionase-like amidohydrolase